MSKKVKKSQRKMTKAGALLKIGREAYKRGEKALSRDIWALAMEEEDADYAMDMGPSMEDLKQSMEHCMESGDLAGAQEALDEMKAMQDLSPDWSDDDANPADLPSDGAGNEPQDAGDLDPMSMEDATGEDEGDDLDLEALEEELEEEEAAGGEGEEDNMSYLSDAQVGKLVKLAGKIHKAGHRDQSRKILAKLGF